MAPDPLHNVITVHHDKVLIVDFGSQVTQLIARRVRGVTAVITGRPIPAAAPWFWSDQYE